MKIFTQSAFVLLLILCCVSGCQTVDTRGHYIDDDTISKLENKSLNKTDVENLIGIPTFIPDYTADTWYYAHRFTNKRAWFLPKVSEQRIVKIAFNKNGVIEEARVLSDNHNEAIEITDEYTKSYGTQQNGVQTFIKNIGRFNKTTDGKRKHK